MCAFACLPSWTPRFTLHTRASCEEEGSRLRMERGRCTKEAPRNGARTPCAALSQQPGGRVETCKVRVKLGRGA